MADISEIRRQIIEFANNDKECGWVESSVNGKAFKFPRRALMWYVFGESAPVRALLPPYEPFSGHGLKMDRDNPYHTDAWLGGGFDPKDAYGESEKDVEDALGAFLEAKYIVEDDMKELISFDFTVLANGLPESIKSASLMVYESERKLPKNTTSSIHINCQSKTNLNDYFLTLKAICIPHAGIEYDLVAKNADVIITEVGGKLAHLATVSRESGKLLIRVDDAMKKFPIFSKMKIDLNEMTLRAEPQD